ncbi:MAG: hypothetical protein PHU12_03160 [Candidatus Aenigmarchaeota archaeon]|nr:hypothetical protein [Candidatus Aenigmarchaeota archaeon]
MPEKGDIQVILSELVRRMNESSRRLRALEEKISLLDSKVGSIQDITLKNNQKARDNVNKIEGEFSEVNSALMKVQNDVSKVNKNLERFAKKSDVKELESMISLFNPLKASFITKEEVKRLLEER